MDKVLMDTNAYRYLATGRTFKEIDAVITELKEKERSNNIEVLLAPIVAQELLAHVASKDDLDFEKCLKALKAQYLHAGDHEKFNYLATQDMQLSKMYFNIVVPSKIEHNNAIGQIAYHLSRDPSEENFKVFKKNLNLIKQEVHNAEENFVSSLEKIVLTNDPSATDWHMFKDDPKGKAKFLKEVRSEMSSIVIALGYLKTTHDNLFELELIASHTDDDLLMMATNFVENFPEPIALYKEVLERFTRHPYDMRVESRANFLWDIELMFNMGKHTVEGAKLFFITQDKAMVHTAVKTRKDISVYDFDEYMEYLGLDHNKVEARKESVKLGKKAN